jgi:hypothetical protein
MHCVLFCVRWNDGQLKKVEYFPWCSYWNDSQLKKAEYFPWSFSVHCHFSKYIRGNIRPFSIDCHFSKYIRGNIRPFSVDCHFSEHRRGHNAYNRTSTLAFRTAHFYIHTCYFNKKKYVLVTYLTYQNCPLPSQELFLIFLARMFFH